MVTSLLQFFAIDVYALVDLGTTLSFVTPLVARMFDIFPNIQNESLMVSNPVDE